MSSEYIPPILEKIEEETRVLDLVHKIQGGLSPTLSKEDRDLVCKWFNHFVANYMEYSDSVEWLLFFRSKEK